MIRNYQRSGGGGTVDLVPIYNSLNAIQNEINSLITVTKLTTLTSITAGGSDIEELSSSVNNLSSSVTALSTAFTSHASLYDYRFRTFESGVKSSINSLSSSIMDINSIISTLSTGGDGGKTLTNPTESIHLFTDPVLYSGPDIENGFGGVFNNVSNTYMKGVTWRDYPSTVSSSPDRTLPAYFAQCLIYGDFSLVNVYQAQLVNNTALSLVVSNVSTVTLDYNTIGTLIESNVSLFTAAGGAYNAMQLSNIGTLSADPLYGNNISITSCTSISAYYNDINALSVNYITNANFKRGSITNITLSQCSALGITDVNANNLYVPDAKRFVLSNCRVKDLSIEYPTTVTRSTTDYLLYLSYNTIDKMNASVIDMDMSQNDIWTANLYYDYDLMQGTTTHSNPLYCVRNTFNELSIFNNDHGTGNTTNSAISRNGIFLNSNSIRQLYNELYCDLLLSSCTIETLKNTLGVSLSAVGNNVQEWECEVSPFSALLHNTSTTKTLALMQSNTVGKWNLYHGISDKTLITNTSLSNQVIDALNSLSMYVVQNSASYVTFDVLNPLTVNFNSYLYSGQINVANRITFAVSESIGTLNMVKNEDIVNTAVGAEIRAFSAHSVGMTNVYPKFVAADGSVDILNMYMDGLLSSNYALSNITAKSANIKNFAYMSVVSSWLAMLSCSIDYFDYEQAVTNRIRATSNTIDYCSLTGGNVIGYSNSVTNMNVNVNAADMRGNSIKALGGTILNCTLDNNSLSPGGFYYSVSGGRGNTIARLNNSM